MGKGRRVAIEPNIYRYERTGRLEGIVEVTGRPVRRKRFPADKPLAQVRAWVASTRQELQDEVRAFGVVSAADARTRVGTLAVDVANYLEQIKGRPGTAADRSHLRAWLPVVVPGESKPLGELDRTAITSAHINKAIAVWRSAPSPHAVRRVRVEGYQRDAAQVPSFAISETTVRAHRRGGVNAGAVKTYTRRGSTITAHVRAAGCIKAYERTAPVTSGHVVAARTIRHRCRVLADLYHTLDGKQAPTPVDEAKIPAKPKTPPIVLPSDAIQQVLTKLAQIDAQTFARFAVVTTTGQRPCQVGRAQPDDLNLEERVWIVRDAKGEQAHPITLNDTQVAAWETFITADAWGAFDTSKYGKTIHAAGWPKGIKPYAARHSIAREAIRRGVNLGDVQGLLGHADPSTTRIYAPFVVDRQRQVSDALTSYLADVFRIRKVKG